MSKFPRLLFLLIFAAQARAELHLGGIGDNPIPRLDHPVASGHFTLSVPEPGVIVALVSGAAMLLARRRR